jgi:signal peptidase I
MISQLPSARTAVRWLVRIVLVAFLAVVVAALGVLVVIPRVTHGAALTVLTGSMTPGIPVGSVVIDRPVDPGTLHVGDIATYQKAPGVNEYITHRIVKVDTSGPQTTFTFKGDANRGPDLDPVPAGAIRGEVWFHVPYLGGIRDGLGGAFGRTLLLAVVILGLAGYAARQFVGVVRERRTGPGPDEGADQLPTLAMDFPIDVFGYVDPSFVAELMQGECELIDDTSFRLTFAAPSARLDTVRELLGPYGTEAPAADRPAAADTEIFSTEAAAEPVDLVAAAEAPREPANA